jgi:hypothetical protein
VIDITETEEINKEIQDVTEKRFDLSMSAPTTMSLLCEKLGFLSNTNFAISLLQGNVHIPDDVDNITTTVIEEIIRLFQMFQEDNAKINLGESEFWYYWRKFRERTLSSILGAHAGHYKSATFSDMVTNFLSKKYHTDCLRWLPSQTVGPWSSGPFQKGGRGCVSEQVACHSTHGGQLQLHEQVGIRIPGHQQDVCTWLHPRGPVQSEGEHSRRCSHGQSTDNGHLQVAKASACHNVSGRRQMLQPN